MFFLAFFWVCKPNLIVMKNPKFAGDLLKSSYYLNCGMQFSNNTRYSRRRNDRGDHLWPMCWSSPTTIVMIFMARSSHLGQVLLRDRMPLLALFLNLDDAHASCEEIPERGFDSNCPWPPPEPLQRDCWQPPLSEAEVQVNES